MEIQGTMLKIRRYEGELDKTRQAMKNINRGGEQITARPGSDYWNEKPTSDELPRRTASRGRLQKGSMYRNKPVGIFKAKISELLDQLEENNQTILLQRLQVTSLREELFAA